MQADRELLELAAKAAGIEYRHESGYRVTGMGVTGMPLLERWNPLYDDGDALRLAVKLQLQVTPGTYNKDQFSAFHAGRGEANEYWNPGQDEYAATRRAIVRAAAAIGEKMG